MESCIYSTERTPSEPGFQFCRRPRRANGGGGKAYLLWRRNEVFRLPAVFESKQRGVRDRLLLAHSDFIGQFFERQVAAGPQALEIALGLRAGLAGGEFVRSHAAFFCHSSQIAT